MPFYKLLLRLEVQRDCAWERRYHRKIRGRLVNTLRGSEYNYLHDGQQAAFAFSDPMPFQPELSAGDELHMIVTSPELGVLKTIAGDLASNPEMTAGSFIFETRAAKPLPIDVGPAGSAGTINTSSGIVLTVGTDETGTATPDYWTDREHTVATFRSELHETIRRTLEHETDCEPPERELFEDYHHRKTFATDVEVTPANDITVLSSKFDFGYEVRDETHRRQLNAVLATGLGAKRSYGFGTIQTDRETDPNAPSAEGQSHA